MKNFEMPKMNVSVFSSENIVTTSTQVSKQELAVRGLTAAGVTSANTTVVNASEWVDA